MNHIFKILLLVIAAFSLTACEENLEDDNRGTIQAVRNGEFFRTPSATATVNMDGSLTIVGINSLERLEFNLSDSAAGTYTLGAGSDNEVIYTFNDASVFSSNEGLGNGQVVLSSSSVDGSVSGTFSYEAFLANNTDSLYMRRGVIFQVPFGAIPNTGGGNTVSSLTANVDGTVFTPIVTSPVATGGTVFVNSSNGMNSIILTFPDTIMPGTYPIAATGLYTATYLDGGTPADAISGSLVITAVDAAASSVTGTFEFMTGPPNNFDITDGTFTAFY